MNDRDSRNVSCSLRLVEHRRVNRLDDDEERVGWPFSNREQGYTPLHRLPVTSTRADCGKISPWVASHMRRVSHSWLLLTDGTARLAKRAPQKSTHHVPCSLETTNFAAVFARRSNTAAAPGADNRRVAQTPPIETISNSEYELRSYGVRPVTPLW